MAGQPEVVGVSVHHKRASDHAQVALKRDETVCDADLGHPIAASLYIAEVADVADLSRGRAVVLGVGVEMGSGRNATVGVVAELVDVETVEALGKAGDFSGYGDGGFRSLLNGKIDNQWLE